MSNSAELRPVLSSELATISFPSGGSPVYIMFTLHDFFCVLVCKHDLNFCLWVTLTVTLPFFPLLAQGGHSASLQR